MASRRRRLLYVVIAVVIVAVLIAGALFGGLLEQFGIANTKSQFYQQSNRGISWRGHFQDFSEMLDSAQYVTSWKSTEDWSEKIVGQVQVQFGFTGWSITNAPGDNKDFDCAAGHAAVYQMKYGDKTTNVCYALTGSSGQSGWNDLLAGPLFSQLQGPYVGVMTVDLYVYERDLANPFSTEAGFVKVAHDEGNLLSGAGSCVLTSPVGRPAKPGETISTSCDIGSAGSNGWQIIVGGATVASLGSGPAFNVKASFPAPSAPGIYEAHLVSGLYPVDFFPFTVNVNPDQAPPKPTMSVDPAPPWQSNAVIKLSWHSDVNPTTKSPILTTHVVIKYTNGDPISGGGDFPGADGSTTFTLGRDTDVEIYVVSEDANGVSEPADATFAVVSCDYNNQCPPPPGSTPFNIPLWIYLVVIGAILILLAVFLPMIPLWPWKVIMFFIAVIFLLVAALVYPR